MGITLGSSAGEQLWGAALGSSFEEQLWKLALGNRFEACRGALENSFGKQLRGTALGSSFGKLSGATFRKNCFEEQQLSGAILQTTSGSSFQ